MSKRPASNCDLALSTAKSDFSWSSQVWQPPRTARMSAARALLYMLQTSPNDVFHGRLLPEVLQGPPHRLFRRLPVVAQRHHGAHGLVILRRSGAVHPCLWREFSLQLDDEPV